MGFPAESMRSKAQIIFNLLILLFFVVFLWMARGWPLQARLFPFAIGIPMLLIAAVRLVLDLKGTTAKTSAPESRVDFQFTQGMDSALVRRRTITMFLWIWGGLLSIWLFGFALTIPLLVFLYLKVHSSESWFLSVSLTASAWLILWGLFDELLHLPFPRGLLFEWLARLGS